MKQAFIKGKNDTLEHLMTNVTWGLNQLRSAQSHTSLITRL